MRKARDSAVVLHNLHLGFVNLYTFLMSGPNDVIATLGGKVDLVASDSQFGISTGENTSIGSEGVQYADDFYEGGENEDDSIYKGRFYAGFKPGEIYTGGSASAELFRVNKDDVTSSVNIDVEGRLGYDANALSGSASAVLSFSKQTNEGPVTQATSVSAGIFGNFDNRDSYAGAYGGYAEATFNRDTGITTGRSAFLLADTNGDFALGAALTGRYNRPTDDENSRIRYAEGRFGVLVNKYEYDSSGVYAAGTLEVDLKSGDSLHAVFGAYAGSDDGLGVKAGLGNDINVLGLPVAVQAGVTLGTTENNTDLANFGNTGSSDVGGFVSGRLKM